MTAKHKGNDYKLNAVEYYLVGDKSQVEVCEIFKCSPRSLIRWIDMYEKDGEIKRHNKVPIAYFTSCDYWLNLRKAFRFYLKKI
jgi:transposase-like protein